eukprot:3236413-Pyramimonas_sp.AAC.1
MCIPFVVRYVEAHNGVLRYEEVDLVALDHAGDIAGTSCIHGHVVVTLHTIAQRCEHSTDTTLRLNNDSPTNSLEIATANFGRIACALRLRTSGL